MSRTQADVLQPTMPDSRWSTWLLYAISSGACAALNGVFAKLTTAHLTTSLSIQIAHFLNIARDSVYLSWVVRGAFLALNVTFNGIMWALFTKALTLGNSTVRVSVINTSANFVCTAVLGALVFGEELKGLWWLGAALLVVGSVIIGRRDENVLDTRHAAAEQSQSSASGIESKRDTNGQRSRGVK